MFLCAFMARLLFLLLMLSQMDSDMLLSQCPDAFYYLQSATAIREGWNFSTDAIDIFGPGYPTFLALLQLLTDSNAILMMLAQIILSSCGSVLLFHFAEALTGDKRVALIAGLLNALSLTSISLANIPLSETLSFVMVLLGLLLFLKANETGQKRLYLGTAFALAVAALVRSANQFLFFLLPLLAWLLYPDKNKRRRRITWSLVTCAATVILMSLWAQQFYRKHHVGGLAMSQLGGLSQMVCLTHIRIEHTTGYWARAWSDSLIREREKVVQDKSRATSDFTSEYLNRYLRENPRELLLAYLSSVENNVHNESGLQELQLPKWAGAFNAAWAFIFKYKLNYRVTVMAAIGCLMLLYQRKYRLLVALLLIYGYFAALAGFSMWQTSRIFYPGEIAWAVLMAVPLAALYEWVSRLFERLSHR